jgi:hypothetical protein
MRWGLFLAVAGGLTALWLVLCLPKKEDTDGEVMPYTTKRAGWPDYFARWSADNATGATTYSSFFMGTFLIDLAVLAVPVAGAWFAIRLLSQQPGQEKRPDENKGRQRSSSSLPTRPAPPKMTGGTRPPPPKMTGKPPQ